MGKIDHSGKRFGKITVIKRIGTVKQGKTSRSLWLCRCDCGKYLQLPSNTVQKGVQKSCGCARKGVSTRNGGKREVCEYEIYEDFIKGRDKRGKEFVFDIEDYDKIKPYCWYVGDGGVKTSIDGKTVYIHRLVMGLRDKKLVVDHINHDRTDNRKENLRIVKQKDNMKNRLTPINNTSGRMGVYYFKNTNKYEARLKINGKNIHGGYFDAFEEAVKRREELEKEYFGEFRNKNL